MSSGGGSGEPSPAPNDKNDADGARKSLQPRRHGFQRPGVVRQQKFEGRCEELKGHIHDCSDPRQSDMFGKTTKEIAEHVGRKYTYGGTSASRY